MITQTDFDPHILDHVDLLDFNHIWTYIQYKRGVRIEPHRKIAHSALMIANMLLTLGFSLIGMMVAFILIHIRGPFTATDYDETARTDNKLIYSILVIILLSFFAPFHRYYTKTSNVVEEANRSDIDLDVLLSLLRHRQGLWVFGLLILTVPPTFIIFTWLGTLPGMSNGEFPEWTVGALFALTLLTSFLLGGLAVIYDVIWRRQYELLWVIATYILDTLIFVCLLVVLEWAFHGNIGEEFTGKMHVHHYQFGAIFACCMRVIHDKNIHMTDNACMWFCTYSTHVAVYIIRSIFVSICLHGVWNYGADPTFDAWSWYSSVVVSFTCLICIIMRISVQYVKRNPSLDQAVDFTL